MDSAPGPFDDIVASKLRARARFFEVYLADLQDGRVRTRTEYQSQFPGHEDFVGELHDEAVKDGSIDAENESSPPLPAESDREHSSSLGPEFGQLGPYQTVCELGRGGQGVVYLAEDTRLGRKVALKVMTQLGPGSEDTLRRFQREAEVPSRLQHPGICGVHDAGVTGGVPYIAMQYVEGESLADRLAATRQGEQGTALSSVALFPETEEGDPTTPDGSDKAEPDSTTSSSSITRREIVEIVQVFEKAARALHAAHEAGVLHRDIKPGNIMLTADGEPVILDFGLARSEAVDQQTLTRTGDVFGTPAYMSPEQLTGQRIRLDRRTDVYSLGATLYECLTLRKPFEAPTREALYQSILTRDATDARKLNPALPLDLKVVLDKALEKDRDRRYETALDLAEELRRVREYEPIQARPAGPLRRVTKWARRNPALATAVLGLFFALSTVAAVLVVKNQEVRARLEETRLLLDARNAGLAAAQADELWPTRAEQVRALDQWLQRNRELVERLPSYRAALERLREREGTLAGEAWTFADGALQDEHDELEKLVQDLGTLADDEDLFARMERRKNLAASIVKLTVDDRAVEWQAVRARIEANQKYPDDLTLEPQVGLIPLGPDPESELEEFLHLETHADGSEIPVRDADERLTPLTSRTGIIFVLIPVAPGEKARVGAQSHDPDAPYHDKGATPGFERLRREDLGPSFFLSKYEMTQGQWSRTVGENPSWPPPPEDAAAAADASSSSIDRLDRALRRPVNMVSWHECTETMARLGLTLPTEWQWEYAARAGTETAFWAGQKPESLAGKENLFDQTAAQEFPNWSARVGAKPAPWTESTDESAA